MQGCFELATTTGSDQSLSLVSIKSHTDPFNCADRQGCLDIESKHSLPLDFTVRITRVNTRCAGAHRDSHIWLLNYRQLFSCFNNAAGYLKDYVIAPTMYYIYPIPSFSKSRQLACLHYRRPPPRLCIENDGGH